MRFYPNPANEYLFIELDDPYAGNVELNIFDLTGRQIDRYQTNAHHNVLIYPCSKLKAGAYLIDCILVKSHVRKTGRFVKE
jgi:hypothetical protein